ncbi:hypothetical protein [Bacillus cereus]|uniref:hypothetical protein n=1 Tax=Bacillus cereus TaxID=1396 RepID=UPI000BFE5639|nr:hypothetical protein [Bacillus cereus]PGQ05205.1 hypothetical protein COA09_27325 [Bacillus cereus]PGS49183.1 hypothetical protein COC67_28345 [Bacillus cereus]PGU88010.1 hypothetical protein COD77_32425 [Bacillus cereus]
MNQHEKMNFSLMVSNSDKCCNNPDVASKNNIYTDKSLDANKLDSYKKCNVNTRSPKYLLDINGNPVQFNRQYYLRTRYGAKYGGISTQVFYQTWGGEQYLDSAPDENYHIDERFTFSTRYGNSGPVELETLLYLRMYAANISDPDNYAKVCYLPGYGVCLGGSTNAHDELWIPVQRNPDMPNTCQFQNYYTEKFLGSNNPGGWIYPDKSILSEGVNFEIVPIHIF